MNDTKSAIFKFAEMETLMNTLIIGASGTVGQHIAQELAASGVTVRLATSRTPTKPNEVQANLLTGLGWEDALKGQDSVFMMSPPGYTNQDTLLGPVIERAQKAEIKNVVLMTAMGANADDNAPLRKAELALEGSGLGYAIIRPNWFMQNFNSYWLGDILTHNEIRLPVGLAKGSFIDSRDIAAVAATLLRDEKPRNAAFDLTGSEALDHDQVAKILTEVSGRQIKFVENTPEACFEALISAGLPDAYAEFLVFILGAFKAGFAEHVTDAMTHITGKAPRLFKDYAFEHRSTWIPRS